jgi:hypothetical protein
MVLQIRGIPLESSPVPKSIQKVSITATCRLEWNYQLSKKIMAFSLSRLVVFGTPPNWPTHQDFSK